MPMFKNLRLLVLLVFGVSCTSISGKDEGPKVEPISMSNLALMFHDTEIETKSWKMPEGLVVNYLSKQTFHIQKRKDVILAFYGSEKDPMCVDFYVPAGNGYNFLIGHDTMDYGKIITSKVETQGDRVFVDFVRFNAKTHKYIKYSYEISPDNTLVRTMSSFITDEK